MIGDDIENPGNAGALRAAAEMFDWECHFVKDARHSGAAGELSALGATVLALENASGAEDLFRFRPPAGKLAVIVGNERKGISPELLRRADRVIQIPIASAHINTLNVAAAAAVALYSLSRGRAVARGGHARGRPEVLLAGPADAIEVGSAVRSAACFGWTRLFIDDPHGAWFETDRVTRSLGRGAARRGRNPIRVLPACGAGEFEEVYVISARACGEPLRRADFALGQRQLVVIPDESGGLYDDRAARALGRRVRYARLEVDYGERRPFRLVASIALAEIARQVGRWRPSKANQRGIERSSSTPFGEES